MQAVIVYESKNLGEAERTGYIDRGSKAEGEMCEDDNHHDDGAAENLTNGCSEWSAAQNAHVSCMRPSAIACPWATPKSP